MRFWILAAAAVVLAGSASLGEVEELFSKHVRVRRPRGEFAGRLIKTSPAGGAGWREVVDAEHGYRLWLPDGLKPDARPEGNRRLQVVFSEMQTRPRPVLRIDVFKPQEGDPAAIDAEYVEGLVDQYPQQAFEGRFTVRDSGLVLRNKQPFAMIGGAYAQGAAPAYRLQWSHLSPERQVFVTFDCAEAEWSGYADLLARVLLSLEMPGKVKQE